jgi:hypothetical protein
MSYQAEQITKYKMHAVNYGVVTDLAEIGCETLNWIKLF